jgi:uncharacterized OB-fold protein
MLKCVKNFRWKCEKKRQLNEVDMDGKGVLLTFHADTGEVDV